MALPIALASAAILAALSAGLAPGAARAGARERGTAYVVFTRWVTGLPAGASTSGGVRLTGVAAGDVGRGRYEVRISSGTSRLHPRLWLGRARYEFHGSGHSFTARVNITENDQALPITASIHGVVTTGWLRGARVTGSYGYWEVCPVPAPRGESGSGCFHGTLQLRRGRDAGMPPAAAI